MHRRIVGRDDYTKHERSDFRRAPSSQGSLQQLRRLDIYARPKDEFQQTTLHGALVSFILAVAVILLVWRELQFSLETETVESLFVNASIASRVNVTFDIVFPRIPCPYISIDAEDPSGVPQSGVNNYVTRTRLSSEGTPIDRAQQHEMGNTMKEALAKEADSKDDEGNGEEEDECNCYGAGSKGECCRTCQECAGEKRRLGDGSQGAREQVDEDEGCRLAGSLELTKTKGNFHFAPGHRQHRRSSSMSFMEHIQAALESFNTTHTIHNVSFGKQPPAERASARHMASSAVLSGHHKTVQDTHAMHQYFLQLVPTTYRFLGGSSVYGSQYSVTEHLKHVQGGPSQGLPGVYFNYDVSPVQALVEERRRGYLSFLTSACGVVGGVYTILRLVNAGIDSLTNGGAHKRTM